MSNPKNDEDLFSRVSESEKTHCKTIDYSERKLYFVTNEENLKQIIISGQIRTREAFFKYYQDFLDFCPGFLPLFIDKLPSNILSSCRENETVNTVILELNLSLEDLKNQIKAYINENWIREGKPLELDEEALVIFVDKALSINKVSKVYFENKQQLSAFKANKGTLNNFDIDVLKYGAKKSLFIQKNSAILDSLKFETTDLHSNNKEAYQNADSKTACLAYLINYLPRVDESVALIDAISNNNPLNITFDLLPPPLKCLPQWINSSKMPDDNLDMQLPSAILNCLTHLDSTQGLSSATLLELNKYWEIDGQAGQRLSARLSEIKNILSSNGSVEDFFLDKNMKSSVLRGFCLLMLYHDSLEDPNLSEGNKQHWNINREDLLFRGIFYAVWKGWMKFEKRPKDKKNVALLNNFQEYLYNGCFIGEKKEFKFTPMGKTGEWAKDLLLRQKWTKKERDYALLIAKKRNLSCLEYEIKSNKDNLTKLTMENNFYAKFKGFIEIKKKIDEKEFKKLLYDITLTDEEKNGYRNNK